MTNAPQCDCVLIIEDDHDIRDVLKMILEGEGFTTYTAVNGRAGLEELRRIGRPCLILLDLMMPVMNGWEFMQALKKEDFVVATIPVVVVSAVAEKNQTLGAAAYIKKPVDLRLLLEFVKRFCHSQETEVA